MNATPKAVVNGVVSALTAHNWSLLGAAPAIKIGPQEAVSEAGNVVVVAMDNYPPEAPGPGNRAEFEHHLLVVGLVPFADTVANENSRLDMIQEIAATIVANRTAGGVNQLKLGTIRPFVGRFFGPNTSLYRGAVIELVAKDVRF